MNLLEKLNIHKPKLLAGVGADTRANVTIERYLSLYGFDESAFSAKIRNFFVESRRHHQRLAYGKAMAACLGLDITNPRDRDALWWKVASEHALDRKMRIKWNTGEADPQLEELDIYFPRFCATHPSCTIPASDDILAPVRLGIARTLTYIRVFPPETTPKEFSDATTVAPEVEACWATLRRHVHYRRHRDLNQHALDSVGDKYGNRVCMDADAIGRWKLDIENGSSDSAVPTWFWPWAIFKYATTKQLTASNRTTVANPHRWIWNTRQAGQADLWRGSHELE